MRKGFITSRTLPVGIVIKYSNSRRKSSNIGMMSTIIELTIQGEVTAKKKEEGMASAGSGTTPVVPLVSNASSSMKKHDIANSKISAEQNSAVNSTMKNLTRT